MLLLLAALAALALIFVAGYVMTGSVRRAGELVFSWYGVLAVLMVPAAFIGLMLALTP